MKERYRGEGHYERKSKCENEMEGFRIQFFDLFSFGIYAFDIRTSGIVFYQCVGI